MIKYLQPSSHELFLLMELNNCEPRQDPWNPAPHILCAIERDGGVFLCMEPLIEFNQPPFKTVANYIDFFKQTLEVPTNCQIFPLTINTHVFSSISGPNIPP
jgi:hypothetical protein